MKRKSCPITRRGKAPTLVRSRPELVITRPQPKTDGELLASAVVAVGVPLIYSAITGETACGCIDQRCVCFVRR